MDSTTDTPIILTEGYAGKVAAACVDVITAKAGIKNKPTVIPITKKKTVDELAAEVIKGLWGDGEIRASKLTNAGYDYAAVQKKVNEMLKTPSKKSNTVIADEVIDGKWGNGQDRVNRLTAAGYDYNAVQKRVNEILAERDKPKYKTYVVRRGDTLSAIARRYNTTVAKLAADNGIKNPNLIYPGQVIKIY
jgi:LysM repeat protein